MITWVTPAGNLTGSGISPGGVIVERVTIDIELTATSNLGPVQYSLIAGRLPRGLRLSENFIKGSPTEVRKFTETRFVIRADDGTDIEDRTFSLAVDGSDIPTWITREGFLKVGDGNAYFVLDNAYVEFQLEADDTDLNAGDTLEYYLAPVGGELPPGLSLSKTGLISGFTDPVFAIDYQENTTGAYDTAGFDIVPLDVATARSNGYDSFFYDVTTFDYSEGSRAPRRLSRFYTFIVSVTDGVNEIRRVFRIWVVTEEFLQADNTLLQVDTNLFQADNTGDRVPLWITQSNLGRFRASNYLTIYLDVYDPPSLSGTISYFLLATNPDGSASLPPPGLVLDTITGEFAGRVPYQSAITKQYQFTMQAVNFPISLANTNYTLVGDWTSTRTYIVNQAVRYQGFVYICLQEHKNVVPVDGPFWNLGVATAEKTFTIDIIGEIESSIEWVSDSDRGSIKPNQPSRIFVEAKSLLYGGKVVYEFVSGRLPPGLSLLSTGIIQGKVKQYADSNGPGLTRFFDNAGGTVSYNTTFDGSNTSFDQKFVFKIKARDTANFAENIKEFSITVIANNTKTFANLYIKAFQPKDKRLEWYTFITDSSIFRADEIYRYGDPNYGVQSELRVLMFAGIESVGAVNYIQAMSRNHYKKQLRFGDVTFAVAKNLDTQEPVYEAIYVNVVDEFEKNGKSISRTVELSDTIKSKVIVSYDAIKIDSDIPLVSDSDHQRIFPNSFKNMRSRIKSIGERDREFLPLWMRSIQSDNFVETGYVKSLVLCYVTPGKSEGVISRIKSSGFDFKSIDFTADRYLIDVLEGEIEDKYLAYPQRGEKLP
jgi:Putative Ig domain